MHRKGDLDFIAGFARILCEDTKMLFCLLQSSKTCIMFCDIVSNLCMTRMGRCNLSCCVSAYTFLKEMVVC